METFTIVSLIHGMRHVIMECMIPSSPSSHFPQRGVTLSIVSMMPPSEAPCELRRTPSPRSSRRGSRRESRKFTELAIHLRKRSRGLYLLSHVGPYRLEYTGVWGNVKLIGG